MSSKKRTCDQIESVLDLPPSKKRKINDTEPKEPSISFVLFPHSVDQKQFQDIYKAVDASILILPHDINKEISKYATGMIKQCSNPKCNADISVLHQYAEPESLYYHEDEYLYSCNRPEFGEQYFCDNCMLTAYCFCKQCKNECCKPWQVDCARCNEIIFRCNSGCDCDANYRSLDGMKICQECKENLCVTCGRNYYWNTCYFVCNICLDDRIIECNECHIKYRLLHKSNKRLVPIDGRNRCLMIRCDYNDCCTFICGNCMNGECITCNECNGYTGNVYCKQHIPSYIIPSFCKHCERKRDFKMKTQQ